MTIYTVHLPPEGEAEKARMVSDGNAWLALAFPVLWLLWYRLWFALAAYLLLAAILALLGHFMGSSAPALLALLPNVYLFLEGRQLLRNRLEREGWRHAGVVEAASATEADWRYFSGGDVTVPEPKPILPAKAPGTALVARPDIDPPIGIFGR